MKFEHTLILASQSPRRRELLGKLGWPVTIIDQFSDEIYPAELETEEIAGYLSHKKANSVQHKLDSNEVLVCADTIVVFEGKVYEKPMHVEDAIRMLSYLSGQTHLVHTGVTILHATKTKTFTTTTAVTFASFTADEISYYVNNFKPFDKAGSYGIQDWLGYIGVESIHGCYYNVMGLPLSVLYKEINEIIEIDIN
jgi:septum formation protein